MQTKIKKFSIITFALLALVVFPCKIKAQIFTLNELISFQKKNVVELNDFLLSKGWSFSNSTDETTDQYGVSTWAYGRNEWEEGKAKAWISLRFARDYPNRVVYSISSKPAYQSIKASIISYGMKSVNTKVGDNIITTDYKGKNYIVRIESISGESESFATYKFTIFTLLDYNNILLTKYLETESDSITVFPFKEVDKEPINRTETIITSNSIFKNDVDSMSYCLGLNVGSDFYKNLKGIPGGKANIDILVMGFSTAIKEEKGIINNDLAKSYFKKYIEKASSGYKSTRENGGNYSVLANDVDSMSYSLGLNVGTDFAINIKGIPGGKANLDLLINAFSSALKERTTLIDTAYAKVYFKSYIEKAQAKDVITKKATGEDFLRMNKTKEGIITTASGLQYQVLNSKNGIKPIATDSVTVHYQGFLIDGKKFDSSVDRGEPITFPLNQVIPGWTEGIQLMSVGSKYKFFVPYTLGYGEKGAGNGAIPGFATMIFEVELLGIKHK